MGYTTEFEGKFTLNHPLAPEHLNYLRAFNTSRRMKRNESMTERLPDPLREAAGLPIGRQGGYYVGSHNVDFGQARTPDILDYNNPPAGQPGLWCQWGPTEDGSAIDWDGGEKFYDYVEWIQYIIEHFLQPWGYVLNGEVTWAGEDRNDLGKIIIKNNVVHTQTRLVVYHD